MKHNMEIESLDNQIVEIIKLVHLIDDKELQSLKLRIHGPGWTTLAEKAFTKAMLNNLTSNINLVIDNIKAIADSSVLVGQ